MGAPTLFYSPGMYIDKLVCVSHAVGISLVFALLVCGTQLTLLYVSDTALWSCKSPQSVCFCSICMMALRCHTDI